MEAGNLAEVQAIGTNTTMLSFSFQCNGTSNPASTTFRAPPGLTFTVTYSATGVFTIVFGSDITFPDRPVGITITPQFAVLATDWFDCALLGEFSATTRTLVVQAHRSGAGQAPANTAGNRINVDLVFRNSTSR